MKSKRGRPKGATSTVRVKLKDLSRYLTPEATVVVGKTWLDEIGLGLKEADINTLAVVKETSENTKIEANDLDLGDE